MLAGAQMITDIAAMEGVPYGGEAILANKAVNAVGGIGFICRYASEKFPNRIRPYIIGGTGDIDTARCDAGKQRMLVKGEVILSVNVAQIILTEPIREIFADVGNTLYIFHLMIFE